MEPDGLRSTYELFDTLYSMHNIRDYDDNQNKYQKTDNYDRIRQNYKIMLDTFYFKLLPGLIFSDKEKYFFDMISKEKLSRRGKLIIDHYFKFRAVEDNKKPNFFKAENTIEDYIRSTPQIKIDQDYSIGELFRILHHSTRTDIFSKGLVKAILASYSFTLPYYFDKGTFEYYSKNYNREEKPKSFEGEKFETLFRIFGGSLLGNWVYEMFGFKGLHAKFSVRKLNQPKYECDCSFNKCICNLLNILMFIRIDKLKGLDEITFKVDERKKKYELMVDLDPTAFFINVMLYDDFIKEIKRIIGTDNIINTLLNSNNGEFPNHLGYGESADQPNNTPPHKYPLFLLPIHQVDLIYNVIKRSVKDIMYISDSELRIKSHESVNNIKDVNKVVTDLYQNIIKYLTRVEALYPVYVKPDSANDSNSFVEIFVNNGETAKIWKKDGEPKKNGEEEYFKYGKFKIKSEFCNYFDFITVDMHKTTDTGNKTEYKSLSYVIKDINSIVNSI